MTKTSCADTAGDGTFPAPELPYLPQRPRSTVPGIGLIGCGGIAPRHLEACLAMGYPVAALCDTVPERAETLRARYFPEAAVYSDHRRLLHDDRVEVVDAAIHPAERASVIEDALCAGRHVLSQKPFVTDLDRGMQLIELADQQGLKLAVNQNARWAPHFSYMRQAVARGLTGAVESVRMSLHWDHNWTAATPFNTMRDLALFDFGIHWFDLVQGFMGGERAGRVYAAVRRAPGQEAAPPLLAHAVMEYPAAQASLVMNGATRHGVESRTVVVGDRGTIISGGPDLNRQEVTLHTDAGTATPLLSGEWFTNGFQGTISELLCAVEENKRHYNSALENLESLALCFAAVASSLDGEPKKPWSVRRLPG